MAVDMFPRKAYIYVKAILRVVSEVEVVCYQTNKKVAMYIYFSDDDDDEEEEEEEEEEEDHQHQTKIPY